MTSFFSNSSFVRTFCHSKSSRGVSLAFRLFGGTYAETAFVAGVSASAAGAAGAAAGGAGAGAATGAAVGAAGGFGAGTTAAAVGAGAGAGAGGSPPSFWPLVGSYSALQHTHSLGLAARAIRGVPWH